jgi:hypothetical protein
VGQGEADRSAEEALELMPRRVRDKLDRAGIKMHLKEWQACSLAERQRLCELPCHTDLELARYAMEVRDLVTRYTGRPPDALKPKG